MPQRVSSRSRLTAFSWGYEGWGNATEKLIEIFDLVESERGFKPPIFVDIRARREVRANGFNGARSPFERRLGKGRYRWMQDLGNNAILNGRGPMRLVADAAVYELLGLILRAQREDRRVVFFCSCPSPCGFATCHRRLVSKLLLRAARSLKLALRLEEWPGVEPKRGPILTLHIKRDEITSVIAENRPRAVQIGRKRPRTELLSLPVGSLVRLKSEKRQILISAQGIELLNKQWRLAFVFHPSIDHTQAGLVSESKKWRIRKGLVPTTSIS